MSARPVIRAVIAAGCTASLILAVSVAASNAALEIRHSTGARYDADLTRAYKACVASNDLSSEGVPACSPPVTSACEYSRGDVQMQALKTSPSIEVQLDLTNVSGPGSCTTGPYTAIFSMRVSADDPVCTSGQCTWIDADIPVSLEHHSNDFRLNDLNFESYLETNLSITPGHVANYEILGVTVIAPDNLPIAAAGVGDHNAKAFRSDVSVWYAPCTAPDTASMSGVPACSAPTWDASCDFAFGEIRLNDSGSGPSSPVVSGNFGGLIGASSQCSNGTYEIFTVVRATGPACSGVPCTLVDFPAVVSVDATNGGINSGASLATSGLVSLFDTVELREAFIHDPLGEVIAGAAVTNAFVLADPVVRMGFGDPANPTDDRLKVRAKFPHPPIDPSVGGATFTVTDQNGTIYSVTIPASGWQVVKPGSKWQYKDLTGVLGGVRKASIKEDQHHGVAGFTIALDAKGLNLSAADLPSVNLVASVSNAATGTSIGMRNAACRITPKGVNCHL